MPTLDTTVLVRFLVSNDPRQARRAETFAADAARKREPLFVPLTVTLELEWVSDSRYGLSRERILATLSSLLETREVEFQEEASVDRALFFYRTQRGDFAECLHLGCAITNDRLPFVTFDRQAARLAGAQLA